MLWQDQFLAQVGSRVAGLPGAHGLTLRARSPGGPRAGFPQHTRREGKLLRDAGRIWVNQWETKGRTLRCGKSPSPRCFLPKFQERSREVGYSRGGDWGSEMLPCTFPSSSRAGSSTPGESPNLSTSGAGTMPLAFRAAKGLQGC